MTTSMLMRTGRLRSETATPCRSKLCSTQGVSTDRCCTAVYNVLLDDMTTSGPAPQKRDVFGAEP